MLQDHRPEKNKYHKKNYVSYCISVKNKFPVMFRQVSS